MSPLNLTATELLALELIMDRVNAGLPIARGDKAFAIAAIEQILGTNDLLVALEDRDGFIEGIEAFLEGQQ